MSVCGVIFVCVCGVVCVCVCVCVRYFFAGTSVGTMARFDLRKGTCTYMCMCAVWIQVLYNKINDVSCATILICYTCTYVVCNTHSLTTHY